jgi:hypothetical protein
MGDDIVKVMDALGLDRAHVVGHAAGGNAGLALALDHPDRIDKLVVVNGWSRPDPHIKRCFDTRLALLNNTGIAAYVHAQPLFLYPADWLSANNARLEAEEVHHIHGFPDPDVMRARIQALLTSTSTPTWSASPARCWSAPAPTTCWCPWPARAAWPSACPTPCSTSRPGAATASRSRRRKPSTRRSCLPERSVRRPAHDPTPVAQRAGRGSAPPIPASLRDSSPGMLSRIQEGE